ncbi:MAG: hypothetical protein AAFR73_01350 [Pseudomonadota bacterium]
MIEQQTYALDATASTDHLVPPLFFIRGATAGPRLVVAAPETVARDLADRFWNLPSLCRMRGSLVIRSHAQDPIYDLPDFTVRLDQLSGTDAYYHVLGRMAELGMISGRGVPLRTAA